jgi:hypothetical protein
MDKEQYEFLSNMIDFSVLNEKSDDEIKEWAQAKWSELMATDYWGRPDSAPYISIFAKYMKQHVPELQPQDTDEDA